MNTTALQVIKDTYNIETLKEIFDHGCQSGVCSQHIYYGDTIEFFDTYEDEIVEFIADELGSDSLTDLFDATKDVSTYKNDCTWTFIELVAMHVVDEVEDRDIEDERTIARYLTDGYNPPASMTETRYALT